MKTIAQASDREHEADAAPARTPFVTYDPKGEHAQLVQSALEGPRKIVAVNPLDFLSEDGGF